MGQGCNTCPDKGTETDLQGNTYCTGCGALLEEDSFVAHTEFAENSSGATSVVGNHVGAAGESGPSLLRSSQGYGGQSSREITLYNAKRRIRDLVAQMRLDNRFADQAHHWYTRAYEDKLTKGRPLLQTIAACLYIACRQANEPCILLDFSEAIETNVYKLGKTFLRFVNAFQVRFEKILDPSAYLWRLAHPFHLDDKKEKVVRTATLIIRSMMNSFIHTGRRPISVCGAALIVAARCHGFSRSIKEMVEIAACSDTTLRKRLDEFGRTASAGLDLETLETITFEATEDPPSFKPVEHRSNDYMYGESDSDSEDDEETKKREELIKNQIVDLVNNFEANKNNFETLSALEKKTKDGTHVEKSASTRSVGADDDAETKLGQVKPTGPIESLSDADDSETEFIVKIDHAFKKKQWSNINADYLRKEREKLALEKRREELGMNKKKNRGSGSNNRLRSESNFMSSSSIDFSKKPSESEAKYRKDLAAKWLLADGLKDDDELFGLENLEANMTEQEKIVTTLTNSSNPNPDTDPDSASAGEDRVNNHSSKTNNETDLDLKEIVAPFDFQNYKRRKGVDADNSASGSVGGGKGVGVGVGPDNNKRIHIDDDKIDQGLNLGNVQVEEGYIDAQLNNLGTVQNVNVGDEDSDVGGGDGSDVDFGFSDQEKPVSEDEESDDYLT